MRLSSARRHPLMERRALDRVVEELAHSPPHIAIGETAPWLESLLGNPDLSLTERARLLFELDEVSQRPARLCVDRYLGACRASAAEAHCLWQRVRSHWATLLEAYAELLAAVAADPGLADGRLMAQLAVRAIRAASCRAKWEAFHGGTPGEELWVSINLAYRLAVLAGVDQLAVGLRADRDVTSTPTLEYLRAIAQHSIGLDQLDAERLELASRLIHCVLLQLELSATPGTTSLYWIDAAHALPPARLVQIPHEARLPRFFSAVMALNTLHELLELVPAGSLPAGLVLAHETDDGKLLSVLSHILRVWSNEAPMRRCRRHPMPGRMKVVEGFAALLACLEGETDAALLREFVMRDASLQGVGMDALSGEVEGIGLGCLVGLHAAEGDRWRVGFVRRLWRSATGQRQLGVELTGEVPSCVTVMCGVVRTRVLLLDPLRNGTPVRLILPRNAVPAGLVLGLDEPGAPYRLEPLPGREFGMDHELRTYLPRLV